jgi:hypothetical protein
MDQDDVRIEIKNDECHAYYRGHFAKGKTSDEAIEKVMELYENSEPPEESEKKSFNSFFGVLSTVFFVLGIFTVIFSLLTPGIIFGVGAVFFGGISTNTSLGKLGLIGGIIEAIYFILAASSLR